MSDDKIIAQKDERLRVEGWWEIEETTQNRKIEKKKKRIIPFCNLRFWKHLGIVVIILYILLFFFGKQIETYMTFPGIGKAGNNLAWYIEKKLPFEEIIIPSSQGKQIHGLYLQNTGDKTVYYFHGNGGPLDYYYQDIDYIYNLGYNVLVFDYPGYGKSEGYPYADLTKIHTQEFYDSVSKTKNINPQTLSVWGTSIGTAFATDFASKNRVKNLILFSPFSSRTDMSQEIYGFPIQKAVFLEESLNTQALVKKLNIPTLIIHGNIDQVIPFRLWQKVFESSISENKYFIELDNFGHNGIIPLYAIALKNTISLFLSGDMINDSIFINEKRPTIVIDEAKKNTLEEKYLKEQRIQNINLDNDTSLYKFVNPDISFSDKTYIPKNMEAIASAFVYDTKGNGKIRSDINISLQKMAEKFKKDIGKKLTVVSSYRSYAYQKGIKDRGCPDNLCAKAGHSEHQSWLSIDIASASSQATWLGSPRLQEIYAWLQKNASDFWFHNTYQKGVAVDGYEIEPWHWRYLGTEMAKHLEQNNMTIAEFYYERQKNK